MLVPLLDHFHPPLSATRHWEAFHARWAAIADQLNVDLPEGYFAEAQVHAGPRVEVDVASFDARATASGDGTVATLPRTRPELAPPEMVLSAVFPEAYSVNLFETSSGPKLVGAVELVSPANKDRDEKRLAFAVKCAGYLHAGIGLIVVDVVTNRRSRPLDDLLELLKSPPVSNETNELLAVSFRPIRANETDTIELRIRSLLVGRDLPKLPLSLGSGQTVEVDLEATYEEVRERSRL